MIKKTENLYKCGICELIYKEKRLDEKCEEWCKKNNSCNLNITKHSIKQ